MAVKQTNLVVANWKLNPATLEEARNLAGRIEAGLLHVDRTKVKTVVCAPFVFLAPLRHFLHFAALGTQNLAAWEKGPYTGEISVLQVLNFRVQYVILGHSERRNLGEDDGFINQKVKLVLRHGLEPILCVGHGAKRNSSSAAVKKIITRQLAGALRGVNLARAKLTVAYEPAWAISRGLGTGRPVSPAHAAAIIGFIKTKLPRARVIYGGSTDADNAARFAVQKPIQGALVGGASLDASQFLKIIGAFANH